MEGYDTAVRLLHAAGNDINKALAALDDERAMGLISHDEYHAVRLILIVF